MRGKMNHAPQPQPRPTCLKALVGLSNGDHAMDRKRKEVGQLQTERLRNT